MSTKRPAVRLSGRAGTWALALAAMAVVVWVRLSPQSLGDVAPAQREELRFRTDDGREYPYAFGYDSYAWLRQARNRVRTGSPCDTIVDGSCRDTFTLAPVGAKMSYEHSPHVLAIDLLHRAVRFFRPAHPLPASAFLVTLIVGALGVPPAFAIGRRLAGSLGGLAAALLVGLNPVFLVRSGTLDNDVWNVVLPLYVAAATIAAMGEQHIRRQAVYAAAAAVALGLHALIWRGWVFSFAVVVAALAANTAVASLRMLLRSRTQRGRDDDLRRAVGALACFAVISFAAAVAIAATAGVGRVLDHARSLIAEADTAMRPADAAPSWPDAIATVGELIRPDLRRIADMTGGTAYFFVGWLGMVLLLLPRKGWQGWHFALLVGANYAYRYLLVGGTPSRGWLIVLLALPLLVAVVAQARNEEPAADTSRADPGAVYTITWFLAALFLAFDGVRFVMLLAAPFGIACGVAIGRLYEWTDRFLARFPGNRAVPRAAAFCVLCLALIPPLRFAERAVRGQRPKVNDAWAETLGKIRAEAPREAIVHTWWPYGYFASYFAERAVSVDGGSLPTHVPHWIGKAFLTDDEDEAAGLFRMLGCGSDATPHEEKERGAYHRILSWRRDRVATYALLVDLVRLERSAAEAKLTELGAPAARRDIILAATHCVPPPSYLVLSNELTSTTGWVQLGAWSPGDSGSTPRPGFWTRWWVACTADSKGTSQVCPLGLTSADRGIVFDDFAYRSGDPSRGVLRWHRRGQADNQFRATGAAGESAPAEIMVAGAHGLEGTSPSSALDENVGVLIDASNHRILVASPSLLRSTLVHLVLLDGRYARRFERIDERRGYAGELVTVWRINDALSDRREVARTSAPRAASAE